MYRIVTARRDLTSRGWRSHRPQHAEGVADLPPAVAPEHDLQRRHDLEAGGDSAVPPCLDVIDLKVERIALVWLEGVAVLGVCIGEHQGAPVDIEVHVHGPALVVGRDMSGFACAESALIEL